MPEFHALRVADVRSVTDEATAIAFEVPPDLAPAYAFTQGQYLTLKAKVGGEELRRSYSICSAVGEGDLQVAVKRVPDGRFSTYANANIKPGDVIDVMTPMGNFHAPLDPVATRHYVGFAGGSGITPFMSIIKTVLKSEPKSRFTLFYGSRSVAQIMFRDELSDLKDRYLGRLSVFHILSDERPDLDLFHGLIDTEKAGLLLDKLIDPEDLDYVFICGPGPMMEAVRGALGARGIEETRQKYELFGTPPPQAGKRQRQVEVKGSAEVTVRLHGAQTNFRLPFSGESLLEAALSQDLDLPYSCKAGVCCTCRAKLVEGTVRMDVDHALEPDEREAGYILTCQSHPTSDRVVVDFDA
jgi:ring-1,2-phenylacetyl-CoA epoxidase subunit PaaE